MMPAGVHTLIEMVLADFNVPMGLKWSITCYIACQQRGLKFFISIQIPSDKKEADAQTTL